MTPNGPADALTKNGDLAGFCHRWRVRELSIFGSARRVSDSLKADHAEIPWRQIVAQRHVIAHEYGEIKQERLWLVATRDVPTLVRQLEPLLPPRPAE